MALFRQPLFWSIIAPQKIKVNMLLLLCQVIKHLDVGQLSNPSWTWPPCKNKHNIVHQIDSILIMNLCTEISGSCIERVSQQRDIIWVLGHTGRHGYLMACVEHGATAPPTPHSLNTNLVSLTLAPKASGLLKRLYKGHCTSDTPLSHFEPVSVTLTPRAWHLWRRLEKAVQHFSCYCAMHEATLGFPHGLVFVEGRYEARSIVMLLVTARKPWRWLQFQMCTRMSQTI